MPKTKTHSATKKRFRLTGSGKLVRRHGMKSHLLERKTSKRKRGFRKVVRRRQGRHQRDQASARQSLKQQEHSHVASQTQHPCAQEAP